MSSQESEVDKFNSESTIEIDVDVDFAADVTFFFRRFFVVRPNVDAERRRVEADR
jgi:hypothetical protein